MNPDLLVGQLPTLLHKDISGLQPPASHETHRHTTYRQFTLLRHGRLCMGNRNLIQPLLRSTHKYFTLLCFVAASGKGAI